MVMDSEERRGIGSVDIAMAVLRVFAEASEPLTLKEVGTRTGMATSKLHRYLSSLVTQGMLRQRERSGRYDLGPFAAALGISALARNDFVNETAAILPDLVSKLGTTAMLSVLGASGSTIVRWERGRDHVITTLGLGTVLPLMTSATGQVFLAYSADALTKPLLPKGKYATAQVLKRKIQSQGYAVAGGDFIPGLFALAVPVTNWQNEAEAVVTLISTGPDLIDPAAPFLASLKAACQSVSLAHPRG
ncbi:MAG: IclR family transcriptional regulator [Alphaproteobacteria bacterium]|nr:IclR family transcriptional regulator [Alphaproteobacteria bacterium]